MILGARRVLVLDESLSMLSSEYVAPCSAFLRKLAAELGFKILMISHEEEFATHADQHLRAEEVGGLLKMTVVFG
jgi:energy-coupling factor transporter ATP-binding protein EcfA2